MGVRKQRPPGTVEVATLQDVWEERPKTRYPVTLNMRFKFKFYATKECKEDDEVQFCNIDFGGGFRRYRVKGGDSSTEDVPELYGPQHLNYVPVFAQDTGELHIIEVYADEARFGGIV